jgi:hypothetical protein
MDHEAYCVELLIPVAYSCLQSGKLMTASNSTPKSIAPPSPKSFASSDWARGSGARLALPLRCVQLITCSRRCLSDILTFLCTALQVQGLALQITFQNRY